jgi:hypothetical protein
MLDNWSTVRGGRAAARALRARVRERGPFGPLFAWFFSLTIALAGVALLVDIALLLSAGLPVLQALHIGAVAASLGCLFAALVTVPLTVIAETTRWIGDARGHTRWLWPLPLVVASLVAPALVIDRYPFKPNVFLIVVLVIAATLCALAVLGRFGDHFAARLSALTAGGLALWFDVRTPRAEYRDLHDFAGLITVLSVLVVLRRARHHLERLSTARLAALAIVCVGSALLVTGTVDGLAPGWRGAAWRHAEYQPRLARLFRATLDLDRDGFSPIAWGGDCDDLDAARNPLAREETVGRDQNCNGIPLQSRPSDRDRGLLRPEGNPDLPPDDKRLAVLITLDCWVTESFTPEVMPRLSEYARRGVTFSRLYAGGSRTHLSLPLLQRTTMRAQPITNRLAAAGVLSTAVLGYHDTQMDDIVAGFRVLNPQTYDRPFHPEIGPALVERVIDEADATAITNRAIEDLVKNRDRPHYLWIHYFDAHWPYRPRRAEERVQPPAGWPKQYGDYLTQVHHIDGEIGRLLDRLEHDGLLARAVVIVTSDHGESFGRHGVKFHGVGAHDPLIKVPGVVIAPGLAPGVYNGLASHRDVPPTILGAFGQIAHEAGGERFGRSWLRLRTAPAAPLHRFVVSRSSRAVDVAGFITPIAAIVEGRLKLVMTFEDGLRELYDLVDDPDEKRDLAGETSADGLRRDLEIYRDLDGYP